MSKVLTRTGLAAAIKQAENDSNLDSLSGINEPVIATSYTVDINDQNRTIEFTNAATITVTLTQISVIAASLHTSDFKVTLKNIGAGNVVITPTTDTFDDGDATKTLVQYASVTIQFDNSKTKWNLIGDSKLLDRQYIRNDVASTQTMIGGLKINYASPSVYIDSITSGNPSILLMENGVKNTTLYAQVGANKFIIEKYNTAGSVVVSKFSLSDTGDIELEGKIINDIYIKKSSPYIYIQPLNSATESAKISFLNSGGNISRGLIYRPAGISAIYLQVKDGSSVTKARLIINETGAITPSIGYMDFNNTGNLKINSTTVTASADELNVLDFPSLYAGGANSTLSLVHNTYATFVSGIATANRGEYSQSTGIFTTAKAGNYRIHVQLTVQLDQDPEDGDYCILNVFKNGSSAIFNRYYFTASTIVGRRYGNLIANHIFSLNAGDTLEPKVLVNFVTTSNTATVSSSSTQNIISIERVA